MQRLLIALSMITLLAGCAQTRLPAPVESRSVSKAVPSKGLPGQARSDQDLGPVPTGFYRVKRGDTLIGISLDHGVSWRDIVSWNRLDNPNLIEVNQLLRVTPPPGARETVARPLRIDPAPSSAPAPAVPSEPSAAAASTPASAARNVAGMSWSWPGNGRVITSFSDPGYKGIALAGTEGDPVVAANDGRVVYSGSGLRGYGNLVIVKHEGDFLTAYAHNRKILVSEGQSVRRGQQIAELGMTDAESPKLHFEVRQAGKPVDPMGFLPAR